MNKFGGHYLHPITFISDSYKNGDFKDIGFWTKEKRTWGEISIDFDHTSYPIFNSNTQCNKHTHSSKIFISKDGLICHDLTENITKDNNKYHFGDFAYHIENDTLYGRGLKINSYGSEPFKGKIALDNISHFEVKEVDALATTGMILGAAAGIAILIYVVGQMISLDLSFK